MESKELSLLKRIKLLMGRKLNTLFVGEYHSAFKGYGLEFDTVREYRYGDDIKNIEWNVSARMNHLYIKEFIEERELSVVLMVDVSGSVEFGGSRNKWDVILEVVTLFLYLAQMNHDRISVLLFTDRVEKYITPRKGRKFILKVLDEIIRFQPEGRKTDIESSIDFLRRVLKKRSVIFLLSDFIDKKENYLLKLRILGRKHDIIPVQVFDPLEKDVKLFGLTEFYDMESGEVFLSDSVPEKWNFPVLSEFNAVYLNTNESIEIPILKFFEKRNRTSLVRSV